MGLFGGGKTSTNSTSTMTPTAPGWLSGGMESTWNGAQGIDPSTLFPGSNQAQDAAMNKVNTLTGSPENYGAAQGAIQNIMGMGAPTMQSESLLSGLSGYQDPYNQMVRQNALQGFDENAGMTRAQQSLDMSRDNAWGGSGTGIAKMLTERGLSQDRSALDSGLLSQGFNTAANLSGQDAQRRQDAGYANLSAATQNRQGQLQAAGLLGDLSSQYDANQRANAGTQMDFGNNYHTMLQNQAQAPLTLAQAQAGILGQLPTDAVVGKTMTTNTTSKAPGMSLFDWFGNNAKLAAQAFGG